MKEYHLAWLSEHPHRSQEWLKAKLKDGFDIHHVDGDHENNDPANLILVEHSDHMMLHYTKRHLGRLGGIKKLSRDGSIERRIKLSRKRHARILSIYAENKARIEAGLLPQLKRGPKRVPSTKRRY